MVCSLVLMFFDSLNLEFNKNNLYETSDNWSKDILNFDFLEEGLGIVSSLHFEYDFLKKNVCHVVFYKQSKKSRQ